MLPIPTNAAVASFAACVALLALALASGSVEVTVLASAGFIGLALALCAAMPLGRRVRRERLEFAWWLAHSDPVVGSGSVVPGAPFEIRCYVRHRGNAPLTATNLQAIVPPGVNVLDPDPAVLFLVPRARTEFTFRLVAPAVGRVVAHGLALSLRGSVGLFEVPLYFPNPLTIRVLPRPARRQLRRLPSAIGVSRERSGRTPLRRRGGGTELYELRDYQPGNPFRSIAWKASARVGQLMVREVEREIQHSHWLMLDVSETMRYGAPGQRKIDHAIEAVAIESRRAVDDGDAIGLVPFDAVPLDRISFRDGRPQLLRIYEALLSEMEVVDEDRTDIDEKALVALVGRYLRTQDGIVFAARSDAPSWDERALVRHVSKALAEEPDHPRVRAGTSQSRLLRRFCRARGITLPHRSSFGIAGKGDAIANALRTIAGRRGAPSAITVYSDLERVYAMDTLLTATRFARTHGHQVTFVLFDAYVFAPEPRSAFARDHATVLRRREERRIAHLRRLLGRAGASVVVPTSPTLLAAETSVRGRAA